MVQTEEGPTHFEPYLSTLAQNVVRNPIRKVVLKMLQHPGCLSLAGGRPPQDVFPESVHKWGGESFTNYGPALAMGVPELKQWAHDFVEKFHMPPLAWEKHEVLMTSGNTDGITKAVMLLSDPGDVVLADEVTYPGIQASALPQGRRVMGVPLDQHGMIPEQLESVLQNLGSGQRARILYVTPHGQNPTGATLSESRKDALYALARKHELVILEDDPYFFVQLMPTSPASGLEECNMPGTSATPRSFLARDSDGRVVRLDSASKMIAPGFRLGWVTGHKSLIAKWQVLGEVFTWSLSGVLQKEFLDTVRAWGENGLHHHLQRLQCVYARRRGYLLAACERHLAGFCKWQVPDFGMFFWLEILGCKDTEEIIDELIADYGIAMIPGNAFRTPEGASENTSRFFRVSFTLMEEDVADKAMSKLRSFCLKSQLGTCAKRKLEESIKEEVVLSKIPKATVAV
jgi:DNA-binding transcriptional MocR family regulator